MDEMVIRINKTNMAIVESYEGKIKKSWPVLLNNIVNLLIKARQQHVEFEEYASFLPDKKVRTVWSCNDNLGGYAVVLALPARQQDTVYKDTTYKNVGYPQLVFGFRVEENKITRSKASVVLDEVLTSKSILYHYPYSNINASFSICWGNNTLPKIIEPCKLSTIPLFFLSVPNNDDSYGKNASGLSYEQLLISTQNKDFDPKLLISAEGKTLGDFTKLLLRGKN